MSTRRLRRHVTYALRFLIGTQLQRPVSGHVGPRSGATRQLDVLSVRNQRIGQAVPVSHTSLGIGCDWRLCTTRRAARTSRQKRGIKSTQRARPIRRRWVTGRRAALLLLAGVLIVRLAAAERRDDQGRQIALLAEGTCRVRRIIDGRTLLIQQTIRRQPNVLQRETVEVPVRLLGISIPSHENIEQRAMALLENWKARTNVRLRLDRRRTDDDGVALGHLHDDDELMSELLVRNGLAIVRDNPAAAASLARRLRKSQADAQAARVGIWSVVDRMTSHDH